MATEETSICVIDGAGSIVLEATVATEPEAICRALRKHLPRLRRVGHEAGSLSPWLQPELTRLGLPAVCLEARHTRAALAAQRNKTDRADARGIAHIMRTGWFRQVHVKSRDSYRLRLLLNQRSNLKRKFLDIGVRIQGRPGEPRPIRNARARAGGRRSADRRVDRLHAAGARCVVAGISTAAPRGGRDGRPG